MLPEFVARTRASRWLSALPTGGSKWLSALPTGSKWSRALPGKEVTGLCNKMAESAIAEQGKC